MIKLRGEIARLMQANRPLALKQAAKVCESALVTGLHFSRLWHSLLLDDSS
jgi:hypothetical protein